MALWRELKYHQCPTLSYSNEINLKQEQNIAQQELLLYCSVFLFQLSDIPEGGDMNCPSRQVGIHIQQISLLSCVILFLLPFFCYLLIVILILYLFYSCHHLLVVIFLSSCPHLVVILLSSCCHHLITIYLESSQSCFYHLVCVFTSM